MLLALAALALLAPTAGDVGSCGQDAVELDPVAFFSDKAFVDCSRCRDCGLTTAACEAACGGELEGDAFDPDCFPLVHDGEVCLNALRAASCDDYRSYVDDLAPAVPTECNFCPPESKPGGG